MREEESAGMNFPLLHPNMTVLSNVFAQLKSKIPRNTDRDKEGLTYINLDLDNLKEIVNKIQFLDNKMQKSIYSFHYNSNYTSEN